MKFKIGVQENIIKILTLGNEQYYDKDLVLLLKQKFEGNFF